jgi:hypothetical protein
MKVTKTTARRKVVTEVTEPRFVLTLTEEEANLICHVFGRLNGNYSRDESIYRKLINTDGITGELPDGVTYTVDYGVAGIWKEED